MFLSRLLSFLGPRDAFILVFVMQLGLVLEQELVVVPVEAVGGIAW